MEGIYPIFLNQDTIGQVQVLRQGLYYRFLCRCAYHCEDVCRIMIKCSDGESLSLGVMVPEGLDFTLDKKLPVKYFTSGEPVFYIHSKEPVKEEGIFAEIIPEEPFGYLSKLKDAFLIYRNGKVGAWIPK